MVVIFAPTRISGAASDQKSTWEELRGEQGLYRGKTL